MTTDTAIAPEATDASDQNDLTDQATVQVEELLVEEVSIDGMCGVY